MRLRWLRVLSNNGYLCNVGTAEYAWASTNSHDCIYIADTFLHVQNWGAEAMMQACDSVSKAQNR